MTDIIERVAKAIFAKSVYSGYNAKTVADMYLSNRRTFEEYARAAIAAMLPVPDKIAERLAGHFNNDVTYGSDIQVKFLIAEFIDTALQEKES